MWDGENCPPKTTGLFPIQSDCRKYLNCFKGRGFVQSCAPGTLFNSDNLECDFPAKVQCLDGNPSKIDSSFINRNPSQNFDLNSQTSNHDRVFVTDTNQYKPQSTNQPRLSDGSQFIVGGHNPNKISYPQNAASNMPVDYGLQTGETKPLYGSNFVTNGYVQSNAGVQSQQFFPTVKNNEFKPYHTPNEQIFNTRLPTKPESINVNTNYPGVVQQQFPIEQNFNQNPPRPNTLGHMNPGKETAPLSNSQSNFDSSQFLPESDTYRTSNNYDNVPETQNSQFLPNQNNYRVPNNFETPNNYENDQYTQNTYLREQNQSNQPKNKVRFPFPKENLQPGYNGYSNGDGVPNPANINPNSWIKGQLKGKQMAGQSSYTNGYINKPTEYEEFQTPNSHLGKPASTFDLGNRDQIEHNKQSHTQNNYDSLGVANQHHPNYNQQPSVPNNQGYNPNLSPNYSPLLKFNQPEQPPSSFSSPDKQVNRDSKISKPFRIVVPDVSNPINNGGQPALNSYSQNTNPSREINSNNGLPNKKSNSYNTAQNSNKNKNLNGIKIPSYTNNNPSSSKISQDSTISATSSKCPNGFNGIKPHLTDCSKFLSCANGRTFEMDCGPGTLFNPILSVCDHPYNVECNRNNVETTLTAVEEHYTVPSTQEYYTTPITVDDYYTTLTEDYNPPIDMRQDFDHDTSSSDRVTETEPLENHNQAVLETLPTENRQFKILKNPSSIDLPDNFLPNSSVINTPPKVLSNKLDNVAVRIDLKPNSTQSIRLRGGPKNSEGFLQVQEKPFQWGVVCDTPNSWTIDKADIVCKQLGFKRYLINNN